LTGDLAVLLLLVALLLVPIAIGLRRAGELFVLRVSSGHVAHVRGKVPKRVLDELAEVLRRARVESAELRVVREEGRPALRTSQPLPDAVLQQLRNVLGKYRLPELRAGARPPPAKRR
jgi:hypothetical protein